MMSSYQEEITDLFDILTSNIKIWHLAFLIKKNMFFITKISNFI